MRIRNVIAAVIAALVFTPAAAADESKLTILFEIPAELLPEVKARFQFEHLRIVERGEVANPDYVFHGQIVGNRDDRLTMKGWLEGMKAPVLASCDPPDCAGNAFSRLWYVFTEAFNRALVANEQGLGQYLPTRCAGSTLDWIDLEVTPASKTGLELGWRYALTKRAAREPGYYFFWIIEPGDGNTGPPRFQADSKTQSMARAAAKFVHENCPRPKRKNQHWAFDDLKLVTQYKSGTPYSQVTAGNERPVK